LVPIIDVKTALPYLTLDAFRFAYAVVKIIASLRVQGAEKARELCKRWSLAAQLAA
jgi:hypothetical protein